MIKVKHILITAGGTAEAIDGVRQISNTSTGKLCALIYEALSEYLAARTYAALQSPAYMVHYVVSAAAVRPEAKENLPVIFYPVTDVKSAESVLNKLLNEHRIDYAVHGMAVSDFTKDYLIEREALIFELAEALENYPGKPTGEELRALLRSVVESPARALDASKKVRSDAELLLSLKRTPKLIEKIKKLSPGTFLVGFKLLKGVSEKELIHVSVELSERNGCDLVLANDMDMIRDDRHEGILLKGSRVVGRYGTKKEIAAGIAGHMLGGAAPEIK